MVFIDNSWVIQNRPLNDGTPRREKGFRPYIRWSDGKGYGGYQEGPLKNTMAEAQDWVRSKDIMSDLEVIW